MRSRPIPELERRRRQLEVIGKKLERARLRKDPLIIARDQLSYESTEARIAELEAEDEASRGPNGTNTQTQRDAQTAEHYLGRSRRRGDATE